MSAPVWRKSSHSGGSQNTDCVELARLVGAVGIRDGKNPEGGMLAVSATDLGRLLSAIKLGELEF
ncbi:DUF397 domain-containing protein [Actinomadura sp. HBU206391]|uniref:DUF397 domain-containing protein n=1 Tax=Actinomadura sp. HBU206391 TaxID=2731692 RepID=UPI00164FB5F3|nr:DUF397 domain-containing protein [Actinomadura sp. HBU206391]MBC6458750.1 DUF397 domain-containing protein [Actinomadura sp. HBU206391]